MSIRQTYFADGNFYKRTARIAVPLALQNLLQSCMSMVDTLMVSWIGMVSAVGTAAQIDVLCNMINYGCIGGIGMFAAQFNGAGDTKSLRRCLGLSLIMTMCNALFWISIITFAGSAVLRFYMNDEMIIANGMAYLSISKYSLLLGAMSFSFSSMYRNTGQPGVALGASVIGSLTNVLFNWLLIFGIGPFPEMGVRGAALGTVIGQCVTFSILLTYGLRTHQKFLGPPSEMFALSGSFVKPIILKIAPLIFNEATFGVGQTLFIKAFGQLGTQQMDAYYVGNQIYNFMTFLIYGYGNAVQIMLGTMLGEGRIDDAKRECRYHIGLAAVLSCILVTFLLVFAGPLVAIFGQEPATAAIAVSIVHVLAVKASMRLYNFMIFCILRSGGDAKIIQVLDSGMEWAVGLPCAFLSVSLFHIESLPLVLLITQLEQLVRLVLGMKRVLTFKWARDLTKLVA